MVPIEGCGGKVYGHEVWFRTEIHREECTKRWHRKGRLKPLLRAVRAARGFREVEKVIEYTEEQWLRVFGSGSENGGKQWRDGQRDMVARARKGELLREFSQA